MDDCLIARKSADNMATFKRELFTRFVGTDEGEVTQYLGCEVIRDRTARTAKLVEAGYAERVLRTFGISSSTLSEYFWMPFLSGKYDPS